MRNVGSSNLALGFGVITFFPLSDDLYLSLAFVDWASCVRGAMISFAINAFFLTSAVFVSMISTTTLAAAVFATAVFTSMSEPITLEASHRRRVIWLGMKFQVVVIQYRRIFICAEP